MALDTLAGLIGFGAFSLFFMGALLLGLIEFAGKLYGTFRCLSRRDLASEQRVIYLVLIWFVPLGWLIYFLLGTERTQRLFADVDIF
ncbi:MAG: hypothetical protein ABEJ07_00105 [Candidatus Nanohaloarchaea archaeon]